MAKPRIRKRNFDVPASLYDRIYNLEKRLGYDLANSVLFRQPHSISVYYVKPEYTREEVAEIAETFKTLKWEITEDENHYYIRVFNPNPKKYD